MTRKNALCLISGLIVGFIAYDWITYHARYAAAMEVVARHGGRAGSLSGWPFGKECRIVFKKPLSDDALQKLAILEQLAVRHYVAVRFDCDIRDSDLDKMHKLLPNVRILSPREA